jgi:hypothetical protein
MNWLNHCHLSAAGLFLNGIAIKTTASSDNYLKEIYQHLELDYPKFYKMDRLSKMALLCVEPLISFISEEPALLFANASSSEETDQRFIHSYKTLSNPSPSLFVYTLPNIVTGELCIRHKWYGENCFFIHPKFDAAFFWKQCHYLFSKGEKLVLACWNETNSNGKEECFVFLISKELFDSTEPEIAITLLTNTYNQYTHE